MKRKQWYFKSCEEHMQCPLFLCLLYIIPASRTNRMIKSIEWFTRLVSYYMTLSFATHEKNGGQLHSDTAREEGTRKTFTESSRNRGELALPV